MWLFKTFFCYCTVSLAFSDDRFWLTTEIVRFEWKKDCAATKYCSRPQLRLTHQDTANRESLSVSWMIADKAVTDYARPFVTFWIRGSPEGISISTEIIGSDPKYGFQRKCDYTDANRIFPSPEGGSGRLSMKVEKSYSSANEKIIVEQRGRCFEAVIAVQKHIDKCPWATPSPMATKAPLQVTPKSTPLEGQNDPFFTYIAEDQSFQLLIASLVFAFIACVGFTCVICVFCCARTDSHETRRKRLLNVLPVSIPANFLQPLSVQKSVRQTKLEHSQRPLLRTISGSTNQTRSTSQGSSLKSSRSSVNRKCGNCRQISGSTISDQFGFTENFKYQKCGVVSAIV